MLHRHGASFFFALALGIARVGDVVLDPVLEMSLGEAVVIEGRVIEEPDVRESSTRLVVEVDSGARILVITQSHAGIAYGDVIRAEGGVRIPRAFETGEGRMFDYAGFLSRRGIRYELSFADVDRISGREGHSIVAWAIALKRWYLAGLAQALPEPHAGLAGGITVGDKRGVGETLGGVFQTVGLTHIVVLSGYNIMIVIFFIERIFKAARLGVRLGASMAVALFFVLMTGFASASVRAALMAVIATVGRATGRSYIALNALILVAAGMLIVNPRLLLYDPGFQLSIIATWGLISIAPLIETRLGWVSERFELRGIMSATIGTQAAVLPLLLYQSGTLPAYSLLANLLVLPLVPVAMLLSFVAGLIGATVPFVAIFAGAPALIALDYIVRVSEILAALPGSALAVPPFPVGVLLLGYAALIFAVQRRSAQPQHPN